MSRAIIVDEFGGPEHLRVREVPEPHAGSGEVRVRVRTVGLNPIDWKLVSSPEAAAFFGVSLPTGFGADFAGVVDEVGAGVTGYAPGDRVFGNAGGRAAADFVVVAPGQDILERTPDGLNDEVAASLPIPARTAAAVLDALDLRDTDTLLVGGAAGGVGVLLVQLARRAGARVIGTGSEATAPFLRELGAEPVAYGDGLEERIRSIAPEVPAAADLHDADAAQAAVRIGVPAGRIVTIAAAPPEGGIAASSGSARPDALASIAAAVAAGELTVPIAGRYGIDEIQQAVEAQRAGHVHGKLVVTIG